MGRVENRAAIAPSLIRFSMSGLIQYLIESARFSRPCTRVTRAPPPWSPREGRAADLEQVGGGEEGEGAREMEDRVDGHAFLDHLVVEARLVGGDGPREACRPGTHHDQVANLVGPHALHLTWAPPFLECGPAPWHKILGPNG